MRLDRKQGDPQGGKVARGRGNNQGWMKVCPVPKYTMYDLVDDAIFVDIPS